MANAAIESAHTSLAHSGAGCRIGFLATNRETGSARRRRAIPVLASARDPGRGRWDADALREIVREYALETLAEEVVLVVDETAS
jgi:hypothetical protein